MAGVVDAVSHGGGHGIGDDTELVVTGLVVRPLPTQGAPTISPNHVLQAARDRPGTGAGQLVPDRNASACEILLAPPIPRVVNYATARPGIAPQRIRRNLPDADLVTSGSGGECGDHVAGRPLAAAGGGLVQIDQATGMLTVQLGVPVTQAFVRLRAYAYCEDRRLADVASDIVARQLRLDPDPDGVL